MSGATRTHFVPGWFADTLPTFPTHLPIALLRLDGDWYDSTMQCLTLLYERVMNGGLVIIDDYYAWDGCARAVHEFLARTSEPCRLRQSEAGISFLVKPGSAVSSAAHGQA